MEFLILDDGIFYKKAYDWFFIKNKSLDKLSLPKNQKFFEFASWISKEFQFISLEFYSVF